MQLLGVVCASTIYKLVPSIVYIYSIYYLHESIDALNAQRLVALGRDEAEKQPDASTNPDRTPT